MREFRFRAWRKSDLKSEGRMYFNVQDLYYFGDLISDDCYIVEQSTGMRDKFGVEIYEGDIVRYQNLYISDGWNNSVIIWEDGKFYPDGYNSGEYYNSEMVEDWKSLEVIGNIHEDSVLLNNS